MSAPVGNVIERLIANARRRFLKWTSRDPSGCLIWTGYIRDDGYGRFGAAGQNSVAHRVAWELFVGPIPDGQMVLHRCDNRRCVDWTDHLFLGTGSDNVQDCIGKKRFRPRRGETHPRAHLTDAQVAEIRALGRSVSQEVIAQRFGIHQSTVSKIVCNRARRAV